jgi:hypothetical protein
MQCNMAKTNGWDGVVKTATTVIKAEIAHVVRHRGAQETDRP